MTTTTTTTTTTMRTLAAPVLPDGCRTVLVECGGAAAVPQQVGEDGRRLCVECGGTVVDVPPCVDDARSVVGASWELFCGARCTRAWQVRASAAAYRRELFSVERGVCRNCGCDCDALARRLRLIAKGDARWEARRRAVLAAWPCARWGEARYANLAQLLVATALDGRAATSTSRWRRRRSARARGRSAQRCSRRGRAGESARSFATRATVKILLRCNFSKACVYFL